MGNNSSSSPSRLPNQSGQERGERGGRNETDPPIFRIRFGSLSSSSSGSVPPECDGPAVMLPGVTFTRGQSSVSNSPHSPHSTQPRGSIGTLRHTTDVEPNKATLSDTTPETIDTGTSLDESRFFSIPHEFQCPICLDPFTAPVKLPCCNNSFCMPCLLESQIPATLTPTTAITHETVVRHCPMCRAPLKACVMGVDDDTVEKMKLTNATCGCGETIKLTELRAHLNACSANLDHLIQSGFHPTHSDHPPTQTTSPLHSINSHPLCSGEAGRRGRPPSRRRGRPRPNREARVVAAMIREHIESTRARERGAGSLNSPHSASLTLPHSTHLQGSPTSPRLQGRLFITHPDSLTDFPPMSSDALRGLEAYADFLEADSPPATRLTSSHPQSPMLPNWSAQPQPHSTPLNPTQPHSTPLNPTQPHSTPLNPTQPHSTSVTTNRRRPYVTNIRPSSKHHTSRVTDRHTDTDRTQQRSSLISSPQSNEAGSSGSAVTAPPRRAVAPISRRPQRAQATMPTSATTSLNSLRGQHPRGGEDRVKCPVCAHDYSRGESERERYTSGELIDHIEDAHSRQVRPDRY
eukprot:GHVN01086765.1.p1 GENE.GHVN01086765.1~~GHVN01086765.1.p1  ORF type:complete len:577 (+),score=201.96 GHVN01086765.1:594-2324(+)